MLELNPRKWVPDRPKWEAPGLPKTSDVRFCNAFVSEIELSRMDYDVLVKSITEVAFGIIWIWRRKPVK